MARNLLMNNKDLHRVVYRHLLCQMKLNTATIYYHEEIKKRVAWPSDIQTRFFDTIRDVYDDAR